MTDMQVKERTERLLEKSGRITPREVLDAYEETGLKPARAVFMGGAEACAVGVLMYRDHMWPARVFSGDWGEVAIALLNRWTEQRLALAGGEDYRIGFTTAFDGIAESTMTRPSERKGFRDGQRVRHFVFGA